MSEPLSLYFGLNEGQSADLEVIAKAALEWSNTVRLAAQAIDPDADVKLQLIDADEGSLRLNTILDWGEQQLERLDRGSAQYPRLRSVALGLALLVVIDAGPTYKFWTEEEVKIEHLDIADEDRELMEELLEKLSESEEIPKANRRFFKTLEQDRAIRSVGVSRGREGPLFLQVPNSQFAERGGLFVSEPVEDKRTSEFQLRVLLTKPTLKNKPSRWQFENAETGEAFSAEMRDQDFLDALEGGIQENVRIGIEMIIMASVRERYDGSEWVIDPNTWKVTKVISPND